MKIDKIKINGFGKIKNKEITLKDGINIIYGANEAGKSTVLKFIQAILFGIGKTKNGKTIADFDKYKPWDESDFSGKISYTLDTGEAYEVFRDFRKKNPVIYQANEDISKQFQVDKSKGISFLEQQVGMDENSFCRTAIVGQQEVKLGKMDTNELIQKISNLVSSGDDTLSFQKSMDKLTKQQNEKIGTARTKDRPMNLVDNEIKRLLQEKNNLQKQQQNLEGHAIEKEQIAKELQELQDKKEALKKDKEIADNQEIKKLEMKFQKRIYGFVALFLAILAGILLFLVSNRWLSLFPIVLLVIDIFLMQKNGKKYNSHSDFNAQQIDKTLENLENRRNDLKLKTHILDTEKANMDDQLEQLARIEEELKARKEVKEELLSLEVSYEIAKECLEKAYDEVKHNLSPKFEQNLCEITSDITGGKYKSVAVNDENGLSIEVENGAYMPVERLSVGTMEEMYLSLRLSMLSEISQETLPILFDETFVYFDYQRLKNMMCYLQDKKYDHQILFFTCTNREEEILKELKIEYHVVELEN